MIIDKKVIDPRSDLQKLRRTTLYRYLRLCDIDVHDSLPVEKMRSMITDQGLPIPDKEKVDKLWFERRYKTEGIDSYENMKRQELIKVAKEKNIDNPFKMKNEEIVQALREL